MTDIGIEFDFDTIRYDIGIHEWNYKMNTIVVVVVAIGIDYDTDINRSERVRHDIDIRIGFDTISVPESSSIRR